MSQSYHSSYPKAFHHEDPQITEVGLDEAGRGPCFGRLYTAGVIWPRNISAADAPLVKDSKKLTANQIQRAYRFITGTVTEWHVTYAEHTEVEQYGPLAADMRSLHRCLDLFTTPFHHILMDGNYFKPTYQRAGTAAPTPHTTVVSGDANYLSIAAASIIAKYHRDGYIASLCAKYPLLDQRYGLGKNKGYLTAAHRDGISKYGISEFHRKTYKCCCESSGQHCPISRVSMTRVTPKIAPKSTLVPLPKPKIKVKIGLKHSS